jgi:hypothetical protein
MNAYKTYAQVDPQGRLTVEGVPFAAGAVVEVLLVEAGEQAADARRCQSLFQQMRAAHQAKPLTEAEIAEEIDAYRSGR